MAKEGRFDLEATPFGSVLWAMLNSIADVWSNDIELVESINSLVRLIGNRSPHIDLSSMSARIMIKKTILPAGPVRPAARKKWSIVRSYAEPILQEMIQSGQGWKQILSQTDRFTPLETGVACVDLHSMLTNADVTLAVPDQSGSDCLIWCRHFANKWKKDGEKQDREQCKGLAMQVSLPAFLVGKLNGPEQGEASRAHIAYVRASSSRSRVLAVAMEVGSESGSGLVSISLFFEQ